MTDEYAFEFWVLCKLCGDEANYSNHSGIRAFQRDHECDFDGRPCRTGDDDN